MAGEPEIGTPEGWKEPEGEATPVKSDRIGFADNPVPSGAKRRFSFTINDNGEIDFDAMRSKSRKELKEVLSSSKIIDQIGGSTGEDEAFEVTDENVKAVLGGIAGVNAFVLNFVVPKFLKFRIDPDILQKFCQFTSEQLDELTPRGVRIANKRIPKAWKKYQDEMLFVGMLLYYSNQMARNVVIAQAMRNMRPRATPAATPSPVAEASESTEQPPLNLGTVEDEPAA